MKRSLIMSEYGEQLYRQLVRKDRNDWSMRAALDQLESMFSEIEMLPSPAREEEFVRLCLASNTPHDSREPKSEWCSC